MSLEDNLTFLRITLQVNCFCYFFSRSLAPIIIPIVLVLVIVIIAILILLKRRRRSTPNKRGKEPIDSFSGSIIYLYTL